MGFSFFGVFYFGRVVLFVLFFRWKGIIFFVIFVIVVFVTESYFVWFIDSFGVFFLFTGFLR